jgi:hypothetical protein
MFKILFQELSKNFTKIVFYAAVLFGAYFLYKNYNAVVDWIKNKFNKIDSEKVPTQSDLKNPSYVIDKKIISNYVDTLYSAIRDMGTNEFMINEVFLNLKSSAIENTVAVWNEWNKRNYSYRRLDGTINPLLGMGENLNLYDVLQSELQHNQSEKNTLINWKWLLKRAGLI